MPWNVNLLASPWYMLIDVPVGTVAVVLEYVSVLLLTVGVTVGKALLELNVVTGSEFWFCEDSTPDGAVVGISVTVFDPPFWD